MRCTSTLNGCDPMHFARRRDTRGVRRVSAKSRRSRSEFPNPNPESSSDPIDPHRSIRNDALSEVQIIVGASNLKAKPNSGGVTVHCTLLLVRRDRNDWLDPHDQD